VKEFLIYVPVLAVTNCFRLLGQASPIVDPSISTLVGNIGVIGVLIWFLYYHTTHSYPQMMAKFAEEVEKLRESFEAEQQKQRDYYERETANLRQMLIENMKAMRNAVHDIKDTAQTAMYQKALNDK
jgi:hypothetical protein